MWEKGGREKGEGRVEERRKKGESQARERGEIKARERRQKCERKERWQGKSKTMGNTGSTNKPRGAGQVKTLLICIGPPYALTC